MQFVRVDFVLDALVVRFDGNTPVCADIGSNAIQVGAGIFQGARIGVLEYTQISVLNDIGCFRASNTLAHERSQFACVAFEQNMQVVIGGLRHRVNFYGAIT